MKSRKITEKAVTITAAIGSAFIMIMVIANTYWASKQAISSTNQAVSAVSAFYLESMADRRSKTIANLINNNFDYMEKAVSVIDEADIKSQDDLRKAIGKIQSLLSLNRFALVDEDDVVYTQYTTYTGGSRHAFLANKTLNDRVISTVFLYGSSKELCLAIPIDIKIMGKQFKACFVQIDINDIVDLLAFDDQESTHFALYSANGGNISETELGPLIGTDNIFDATKANVSEEKWNSFRSDFANHKRGTLTFTINGVVDTICYEPVPDTGWELVVMIRESVIQDQIQEISDKSLYNNRIQILSLLAVATLFSAILFYMIRRVANDKLHAEKENSKAFKSMANTDSMTGVRNKHAYMETEAQVNSWIREGAVDKLALVACDINGLKYVNDTKGHAAGDQLIKSACDMICDIFVHGSVYRIGGDEFVVLLSGKGYDTREETIASFNRVVEENIKKDDVVVSIGYSTLQPEDERLHDIFERADQMMYARKKELKSMGARTREFDEAKP
ncbi:GGDEF domain-containing protein [Butyrivibrio sp. CB08]|uniref:sensor domain-containing diguanylate cyclase n=1 Tax=Butyrivibrio sp. CB08 TaxID=2364879 RepID=UPI000EA8F324|nr:diguanylate cyclase [Butyrivibrio sp. CB08]RKM55356.1 GGDEF domain-containing protein [Butyrivibrio sp. CB08]